MKLKSRQSIKFTVAKRNSRWQGKLTCINPETFKLKELSFSLHQWFKLMANNF